MSMVLIIDDEEGFLHMTEYVLRRAGYSTLRARDGDEGLRLVDEHQPDLVILDDMMPGLSGCEMCHRLKQDARFHDLPIIMHTAGIRLKNPETARAIGADAVLIKPSLPEVIVSTVGRLLESSPV